MTTLPLGLRANFDTLEIPVARDFAPDHHYRRVPAAWDPEWSHRHHAEPAVPAPLLGAPRQRRGFRARIEPPSWIPTPTQELRHRLWTAHGGYLQALDPVNAWEESARMVAIVLTVLALAFAIARARGMG